MRTATRCVLATLLMSLVGVGGLLAAESYEQKRRELMDEIRRDVQRTSREIGRAQLDDRVMEVMAKVPRHEFVPADQRPYAYRNRPLPIGYGQTISQPYIVAIMTDLLGLEEGDRVLEVGTGSGYQAAVLAAMKTDVYTMEIIPELGREVAERLERLGYKEINTRIGDGYYGWQEQAPFDGIIVTAAAAHIPPPLVRQLKPGGRMIIPVGGPFRVQQLTLVEKAATGEVTTRQLLPVAFVPLTGDH
ncbi:MAG: protein-L-isoaspartate(D-aspartate) O-methyltransferase [Acidobacteria bacterium]|nr:MAG: protein-L-isoaspartate(D-aspartate) O-methyltransferase [Acidobacteriota bacterium]